MVPRRRRSRNLLVSPLRKRALQSMDDRSRELMRHAPDAEVGNVQAGHKHDLMVVGSEGVFFHREADIALRLLTKAFHEDLVGSRIAILNSGRRSCQRIYMGPRGSH
jgi:16S rRNA G1207 methylase RsmC